MSGIEFVAVLGIAASAIQVVEFCAKIVNRIHQYSQGAAFEDLTAQLQLFSKEIDHLRSSAGREDLDPSTETVLVEVLKGCRRQLEKLDELIQSLIPTTKSSKLKCTLYGARSVRKDKEMREILGVLSTYQAAIVLHLSRRNLQNTAQIPRLISLLEDKLHLGKLTASPLPADSGRGVSTVEDPKVAVARQRAHHQKHNQKMPSKCTLGLCHCQCHVSKMSLPGSWITPSVLRTALCGCEHREYAIATRLFRKFCVLKLSLHWQESISINCALTCYGMVNYTSPGFVILYRCQHDMMGLPEAVSQLRLLRGEGEINFKEVDPAGESWIEASQLILTSLHESYYGKYMHRVNCAIIRLLLTRKRGILHRCMRWVGEGPHLGLLEYLIELGLDPADAGFKLLPSWPRSCSPDWQVPYMIEDPFFIEAVSMLVHADPGFGSTTRLQRAVLMKDYAEAKAVLDRGPASILIERNFLGQTVFHLAIQNPKALQYLIQKDCSDSIDAKDRNGTTPLMYAAAYNQRDSTMLLLNAGADVSLFDKLNGLDFLGYAMFRNNYDLLRTVDDDCRRIGQTESAQRILDVCLWRYMVNNLFSMGDIDTAELRYLLEAGGNHRAISERGNTLLHLARGSYEAEILLGITGYPVNQQNIRGYTPLMVIVRLGKPSLIRRVISEGASVNTLDNNKMSALHHRIDNNPKGTWGRDDSSTWMDFMNSLMILLISGAGCPAG